MDLKISTIITALTLLAWGCKIQYKTEKVNYNPPPANVREGKRLTMLVCGTCHYNFETKDFSGKKLEDSPKFLGKIYAANITQHPGQGAGQYTPTNPESNPARHRHWKLDGSRVQACGGGGDLKR